MQLLLSFPVLTLLIAGLVQAQTYPIDPGCESFESWQTQSSVRSSLEGRTNVAYPEEKATYWATRLSYPKNTVVSVKGRFPRARYMALQVYDSQRNVMGAINDRDMEPDNGQNNPFRTGTAQGTYTVSIVFGRQPARPAPNTIYTAGLTDVILLYRIYYSNNMQDLTAGTYDPVLPDVVAHGRVLTKCAPRPIVAQEDATVWGRLDNGDWIARPPTSREQIVAVNPPVWTVEVTNRATPYYPSEDNAYMAAVISREFLAAPHNYDLVVLRLRAPTYPNTQAGEVPYLPDRQVRFWSVCQDDMWTTSVNRCMADNQAPLVSGMTTLVISDPSKRPAQSTLSTHGAYWMSWGALAPGDALYNIDGVLQGNESPVHYYGLLIYRQTLANPSWRQSIQFVGTFFEPKQWKFAMGDYWPEIGYCTASAFQTHGSACIDGRGAMKRP
jgi:hypothetical protein